MTMVGIRNNPLERMEPCIYLVDEEGGEKYSLHMWVIPNLRTCAKEGKAFILILNPVDWFSNGQRVLDVLEVVCPDERFWREHPNTYSLGYDNATAALGYAYFLLYVRELFKRGITDWEDIRRESERFYKDPEWVSFHRKLRKAVTNPHWWEKMKPEFEKFKEKKIEPIKAGGKTIAWMRFIGTFKGEKAEDVFFFDESVGLTSMQDSPLGQYILGIHIGIIKEDGEDKYLKYDETVYLDYRRL